jgi:membrane protein DedA with SNARE-associated domain
MPFSGFLAGQGILNFWLVVFIGALGNLSGSLFSYWLGFLVRTDILKWNSQKVSEKTDKAKEWLDKFGDVSMLISRVLPVVRTFISFPLGVLKTKSLRRFSALTFIGSFVWSLFLAWLGFTLGKNWGILAVYFRKFDYVILILILAAIGWWSWKKLQKKQNNV